MKRFCCYLIALLVFSGSVLAQNKGPTNNVISMPWDAFMQLWANAKNEEVSRPRPAYGRFLYMGEVESANNDYIIHVSAKVDITTFSNEEEMVPLFPKKMTLESLKINNNETPWSIKDGYYCAYLGGITKHEILATFTLKPEISGDTKKLQVPFLGQARQELVLFVPEKNIQSYVDYGVSLETIETDDGTQVHAYFKAYDNVSIIWYPKTSDRQIDNFILPSLTTYAKITDEGIESVIKVHLDIPEGSVNEIEVLVPEQFLIDKIRPATVSKSIENAEKKGYKLLRLRANKALTGSQDIYIEGINAQINESYVYSGLLPIVPGDAKVAGRLVWVSSEDRSYSVVRVKDLTEVTVSLSEENPFANTKIEHVYDVSGSEPQIDFNVKNDKQIQVLKILSSEVISTVTESGAVDHQTMVKIDNKKALYLPLTLAKGASLYGLKVNDKTMQAFHEGDTSYLIPIKPGYNEVKINYSENNNTKGFGLLHLRMPEYMYPIDTLAWHVGAENKGQLLLFPGASKKIDTNRLALKELQNVSVWKSYLLRFENKNTATLTVLHLAHDVAQRIVGFLSLLLGIYLFWALTFFFERAYLPESFYGARTFILGTVLSLFLVACLLCFDTILLMPFSVVMSVSLFAFASWQNHLVARRYRVLFQKNYRHVPLLFLILYLGGFSFLIFYGKWHLLAYPSLFMIFIHWVFLKTYPKLVEKRARVKVMSHLVLALFLCLSGLSHAEDIELKPSGELKEGHVYMEWSLIEDLLKKIEKKEIEKQKTAGLKYIFGTGKVTGDISGSFAQVRVAVPVQIMTEKMIQVPVVSQAQVVSEVSLDGSMIPLRRDGDLVFFQGSRSKSGISKLEVEMLLPLEKSGQYYVFKTESEFFKGANVSLLLDDNVKDATIEHVIWQKREPGVINAALDSTGLFEMKVMPIVEPKGMGKPEQASQITASHFITNILESDRQEIEIKSEINIGQNNLSETTLELDEAIKVRNISGEGVKLWRAGEAKNGTISYNIEFNESVKEKIQITLSCYKNIPLEVSVLTIPSIKFSQIDVQNGVIVLAMKTLSETKVHSIKGLRAVDVSHYFDNMPPLTNLLKVFRFSEPDYELKVIRGDFKQAFIERPTIEKLIAHISLGESSKEEIDLNLLMNVAFGPYPLSIKLPAGSRFVKAKVNETESAPILGSKGSFELNLQQGKNNVEIIYTIHSADADLGFKKINLPIFSLRAAQLEIQMMIDKGLSVVPLWQSLGATFKDATNLLGLDFFGKPSSSIRAITIAKGGLVEGHQASMKFLLWPVYLAAAFYLIIAMTLGYLVFLASCLMKTKKMLGLLIILLLVAFFLFGPLLWPIHVIGLALGILIRYLRDFFKNDSSIVV